VFRRPTPTYYRLRNHRIGRHLAAPLEITAMIKKTHLIVLAIAALLAAPQAFAYFKVDHHRHKPPQAHCKVARVQQYGYGPGETVLGSGQHVPLYRAVELLTPKGWRVKVGDKVKHAQV